MKKLKSAKWITLIALVITIIVQIILAGVSLNIVLGNNGIITRARETKNNYKKAIIYILAKKKERILEKYSFLI